MAAVTAGVQQGRNTAAGPSVYQGQIQQQGAAQAAEKVVLLKLRTNSLLITAQPTKPHRTLVRPRLLGQKPWSCKS